jgi:hypothetical protein
VDLASNPVSNPASDPASDPIEPYTSSKSGIP